MKVISILVGILCAFSLKFIGWCLALISSVCGLSLDNPTLRLISCIIWIVAVSAVVLIFKKDCRKVFRFRIYKKNAETRVQKIISFALAFVLGISLNRILTVIVNLIPLPEKIVVAEAESVATATNSGNFFVIIFAVWILGPIIEELSYRGLSYYFIEKGSKRAVAVIITSVLFAVAHGNLLQGVYAFIAALISCMLIRFAGSVTAGITFHIGFNASNFLLSLLLSGDVDDTVKLISDIIFAAVFIGALSAIYLISKINEESRTTDQNANENSIYIDRSGL